MPAGTDGAMREQTPCLIGVDAGTTGLKSLVFDLTGRPLSQAYREYPLVHPEPGGAEQDPEDWWRALCETVREAVERADVRPGSVAGLSISSQGSTVVALGARGELLRPALSWLDTRSAELDLNGKTLDEEDLFALTGLRYYPGWTACLLQWLGHREPGTLRRARHLLLVSDYLIYRMTGAVMTDYSSASRTRMLDLERMAWSPRILESVGVSETQLPRLGASGEIAGKVSAEGARMTGLLEGTPVSLGGFDQSCAALGCGAVTPNTAMVSLGTASMVMASSPRAIVDPQRRVTTSCHAIPDTYALQGPIMTTGAVLRWWRDHFLTERSSRIYGDMDRMAATAPPGADGLVVLPYFSGAGAPHWDHARRGAIVGLSLAHSQRHVIRAILEGVAMQIQENVEVIEGLGFEIDTVRIVGGGAKSALWTEIIGDVLGKRQVRIAQSEVGTLGAAMLAGLGVGLFRTVDEALREMTPAGVTKEFDPERHRAYGEVRRRYAETAARLYGPSAEACAERGMTDVGAR